MEIMKESLIIENWIVYLLSYKLLGIMHTSRKYTNIDGELILFVFDIRKYHKGIPISTI